MKIYINGSFFSEADAKISVFDHGLLYGDGIFEGIRMYNGRVFKLVEHVERLYYSAKAIALNIPMTQEEMIRAVVETCKANNLGDGYIRLVVTRGEGTLGLAPDRCKKPQVIIIASTIQLYPEELYTKGMSIITVPTTRNHHNAINPAIKSLNYLNNILAKIEASNAGVQEAIMLNSQGYVAECTGDNIFLVKRNQLFTPPLSAGALYGITRGTVLDLAREAGMEISEPDVTRYDVYNADECFLTGSAAELIPVTKVDGRQIGEGTPGPVFKKLLGLFHDLTKRSGTAIFE
ncbi:MAG: branched-chain-amino-acid transaminase [Verrucomicrobia bacterium]|jgi:branched-chain amino acid aminotransferase|nr:branched-chain-amino-acid transaminase [Verrucomicrobiota bacterium]